MARDATNMPFPRSTSYQNSDSTEQAFQWRLHTMPKGERVGSLCLAGAVFIFTEQPLSDTGAFILALAIFIVAVLVHIFYYRKSLSKEIDAAVISKQEENLESALEKNPG
jgi:hypothetical protein